MKRSQFIVLCLLMIGWYGCKEAVDEDEQDHEEVVESFTRWTDKAELFVEFDPLVVGELTYFAAHFTDLNTFGPIEDAKVTVSLIEGKNGIRSSVDQPKSPGIFMPGIQPTKAGVYTLVFDLVTPDFSDRIVIENVKVFANTEEAAHEEHTEEESAGEIGFLKEQAWRLNVASTPVRKDTVYRVLKTGGQILPAQGDEITITATASGIVVYQSSGISIGAEVKNGQSMFTVTGGNITDNNVKTEFLKAKSNFERAKADFDRKKQLFESEAIAKSVYEQAVLNFELAESEYTNLSANYSKGGKQISASSGGFIKNLFKTEGAYVEAGEPLAIVTQNKRLTIRADVNQSDYGQLNTSISANFALDGKVYTIEEFDGKLLSFGRSVGTDMPKIPVYFELDNEGVLLPGSYIEIWVKTSPSTDALIVPEAALLEEQGAYSVIVQTAGESYEKRSVKLGVSDGMFIEILSGVEEGERVVTEGAYQVKMASMSGEVPAHGHSH